MATPVPGVVGFGVDVEELGWAEWTVAPDAVAGLVRAVAVQPGCMWDVSPGGGAGGGGVCVTGFWPLPRPPPSHRSLPTPTSTGVVSRHANLPLPYHLRPRLQAAVRLALACAVAAAGLDHGSDSGGERTVGAGGPGIPVVCTSWHPTQAPWRLVAAVVYMPRVEGGAWLEGAVMVAGGLAPGLESTTPSSASSASSSWLGAPGAGSTLPPAMPTKKTAPHAPGAHKHRHHSHHHGHSGGAGGGGRCLPPHMIVDMAAALQRAADSSMGAGAPGQVGGGLQQQSAPLPPSATGPGTSPRMHMVGGPMPSSASPILSGGDAVDGCPSAIPGVKPPLRHRGAIPLLGTPSWATPSHDALAAIVDSVWDGGSGMNAGPVGVVGVGQPVAACTDGVCRLDPCQGGTVHWLLAAFGGESRGMAQPAGAPGQRPSHHHVLPRANGGRHGRTGTASPLSTGSCRSGSPGSVDDEGSGGLHRPPSTSLLAVVPRPMPTYAASHRDGLTGRGGEGDDAGVPAVGSGDGDGDDGGGGAYGGDGEDDGGSSDGRWSVDAGHQTAWEHGVMPGGGGGQRTPLYTSNLASAPHMGGGGAPWADMGATRMPPPKPGSTTPLHPSIANIMAVVAGRGVSPWTKRAAPTASSMVGGGDAFAPPSHGFSGVEGGAGGRFDQLRHAPPLATAAGQVHSGSGVERGDSEGEADDSSLDERDVSLPHAPSLVASMTRKRGMGGGGGAAASHMAAFPPVVAGMKRQRSESLVSTSSLPPELLPPLVTAASGNTSMDASTPTPMSCTPTVPVSMGSGNPATLPHPPLQTTTPSSSLPPAPLTAHAVVSSTPMATELHAHPGAAGGGAVGPLVATVSNASTTVSFTTRSSSPPSRTTPARASAQCVDAVVHPSTITVGTAGTADTVTTAEAGPTAWSPPPASVDVPMRSHGGAAGPTGSPPAKRARQGSVGEGGGMAKASPARRQPAATLSRHAPRGGVYLGADTASPTSPLQQWPPSGPSQLAPLDPPTLGALRCRLGEHGAPLRAVRWVPSHSAAGHASVHSSSDASEVAPADPVATCGAGDGDGDGGTQDTDLSFAIVATVSPTPGTGSGGGGRWQMEALLPSSPPSPTPLWHLPGPIRFLPPSDGVPNTLRLWLTAWVTPLCRVGVRRALAPPPAAPPAAVPFQVAGPPMVPVSPALATLQRHLLGGAPWSADVAWAERCDIKSACAASATSQLARAALVRLAAMSMAK